MSEETSRVITEMTQYLSNVLEKPHPIFGGLPICPFARQARLSNKIQFYVHRFNVADLQMSSTVMDAIRGFTRSQTYDVLFMIHPDQRAMSFNELELFVETLNEHLKPMQLTAFGGHPDDRFNIQGVLTRQEPYLNVTIQTLEKLRRASQQLAHTTYYQNWTAEALEAVGHPH